jgi:AraC family transcriptional regulator of arabinose operon
MKPRPKPQPIPYPPIAELYGDFFRRGPSFNTVRPFGRPDWLLIYTEAGSGRFISPSGAHDTVPGDAVLYAPGDPQDYGTAGPAGKWHLTWVHFTPRPQCQILLPWPVTAAGSRLLHFEEGDVRQAFRKSMLRMIRVSRRKIPGALDLAANALEEALLWAGVAASNDHWLTMDPRVRAAIDYLVANLRQPFLLDTLARHCGASVSRLSHLFKQQTGFSPQQFVERHRMQHACQLLSLTNLTIAEIAAEAGYHDPFYFSNRFHQYAGKTPTQFRREQPVKD